MVKTLIVGAGAAGLTMALMCVRAGYEVCVVDQNAEAGGLNRSWEEDGAFVEHAPRVFSTRYVAFKAVLNSMHIDFDTYFNISYDDKTLLRLWKQLSFLDALRVGNAFLLTSSFSENDSVLDVLLRAGVSTKGQDVFDGLCRRVDGGGITRFKARHLQELLAFKGTLRIPSKPLNPLWERWIAYLRRNGVVVHLGSKVLNVFQKGSQVCAVMRAPGGAGKMYQCDMAILAIPPVALVDINPTLTTTLREHAFSTRYELYYSVFFTFPLKFQATTAPHVLDHPWMVVVVPHYDAHGRYCLSTAATRNQESGDGVLPETCDDHDLVRVMKQIIPVARHACQVRVNRSREPAYFDAVNTYKFSTQVAANIFTCGNHTAHGGFPVTSIENAVLGALQLAQDLLNVSFSSQT